MRKVRWRMTLAVGLLAAGALPDAALAMRQYAAKQNRFMQRDPLPFVSSQTRNGFDARREVRRSSSRNAYCYIAGAPQRGVDPDGRCPRPCTNAEMPPHDAESPPSGWVQCCGGNMYPCHNPLFDGIPYAPLRDALVACYDSEESCHIVDLQAMGDRCCDEQVDQVCCTPYMVPSTQSALVETECHCRPQTASCLTDIWEGVCQTLSESDRTQCQTAIDNFLAETCAAIFGMCQMETPECQYQPPGLRGG